ncbi:UNVERIFIED_CONTAM: hypothetical protein Cloal_3263 [Acetivibrio alkalicellulosi]
MLNYKKRVVAFVLVLCVFFMVSITSFANNHEFRLVIRPPFPGSMQSTSRQRVDYLNNAFVNPALSQVPTNYFLSPEPGSRIQATEVIENISTPGKRWFTYFSGYEGIGNRYCLSAYPANWNFDAYTTRGTWSP